jgi:hypothetical protein
MNSPTSRPPTWLDSIIARKVKDRKHWTDAQTERRTRAVLAGVACRIRETGGDEACYEMLVENIIRNNPQADASLMKETASLAWIDSATANLWRPLYRFDRRNTTIECNREMIGETTKESQVVGETWTLSSSLSLYKVQVRGIRAYIALAEFASEIGCPQTCIEIDYGTLAKRLRSLFGGYGSEDTPDRGRAHCDVSQAEEDGILVRLDHGTKHQNGQRGTASIICLVGCGQTLAQAADHGKRQRRYVRRAAIPTTREFPHTIPTKRGVQQEESSSALETEDDHWKAHYLGLLGKLQPGLNLSNLAEATPVELCTLVGMVATKGTSP